MKLNQTQNARKGRRTLLSMTLTAAALGMLSPLAMATTGDGANWPTKPVRIVVPAASGAADTLTRIIAPKPQEV